LLENEISGIDKKVQEETKVIDGEYALKIAAQALVVATIADEIADLAKKNKREKSKKETDPKKVVESTVKDFSYTKDEVATSDLTNQKQRARRKKRETISTEGSTLSVELIGKAADKIEEEDLNSAISGTLNGKSEALQTAISQTVVQMEAIYANLYLELKDLELETANIMSENTNYVAKDTGAIIDVCDYRVAEADSKTSVDQMFQNLKDTGDKLKDTVEDVKLKVDNAVNTATEAGNNVTKKINSAKENIDKENIDIGEDFVDGFTGM
jgi:hypothetical protein